MDGTDEARYLLARIREAMRSNDTETPLAQAVARLKQPFVLGVGKTKVTANPITSISSPYSH